MVKKKGIIDSYPNWDYIAYFLGLSVLAAFLFHKCKYGFGNIDESFYLTIPYRLTQGDGLFINEWHLSQMSGFLLLPFVKAYMLLKGNTDGIILAFRYIDVVVQLLADAIIYSKLRNYSKVGALLAALFWGIYTPFSITALSYNSMGIICLTVGLVLTTCAEKTFCHICGGILFACAVLCCPHLTFVYVIYVVAIIAARVNSKGVKPVILERKRFLEATIGISICAACFFAFVFSKMSVKDLLVVLPHVLDDSQHNSTFMLKLHSYVTSVVLGNRIMPIICILYVTVLLIGIFNKKQKIKHVCLLITIGITGIHLLSYIIFNRYINHLMFPINICAFVFYVINKDKWKKTWITDLFYGIWVPGILYTICIHFSSNQCLYSITSAGAVPFVPSIIIVIETIKDVANDSSSISRKTLFVVPLVALLLAQGGFELYFRWNSVFWENSIDDQTVLLTSGPEAGLLVSEEKASKYKLYMDEMKYLDGAESVLFLSRNTWLYLCGQWENASFSAWLSGINETSIQKLEEYWEINPDKKPDCVLIEGDYVEFAGLLSDVGDYAETRTTAGNLILRK